MLGNSREGKFQYFVNEEKKIVVCKLRPASKDAGYDAYEYIQQFICKQQVPEEVKCCVISYLEHIAPQDKYPVKAQCIGIAKCDNRDIFDVEKGKKIARAKLEARLQSFAITLALRAATQVSDAVEKLDTSFQTHLFKMSKLTGVNEPAKYPRLF